MSDPKSDVVFPAGSLISVAREDGAVQHVDWNTYLDNHDHPTYANRWMFLQDTISQYVGKLTKGQLLNNVYNFGNARLMNGMMPYGQRTSLSTLGWYWLPYDESNGDAKRTAINDAISFTADFVIPKGNYQGQLSVGTWAKDIGGLIPGWIASNFWCNFNPPPSRSEIHVMHPELVNQLSDADKEDLLAEGTHKPAGLAKKSV